MEIKMIPREKIIPDPDQPREHFEKESIQDLANSMKEFGLLQPIMVKPGKNGTYEIIAGERRWRASKFAGMKELPAIIKDATKQEQEIQGLIENVHREDLSTTEKGKKAYQIFQLYGIDIGSKQLAGILKQIHNYYAEHRMEGLNPSEKKIDEICKKINKKPDSIRVWISAISVSPEIQKAEIKKSKEEQIAGRTLDRLSTIEDEELQKKVYTKIEEQEMGQLTASKFITKVKKLPDSSQEAILTPGIKPEIEGLDIEPVTVRIPEGEARSLREAMEEERRERQEKLSQPEVKEQSRLMNSWLAHCNIDVGHLTCPVCGADHHSLKWTCHDLDIEQSIENLHQKLDKKKRNKDEKTM